MFGRAEFDTVWPNVRNSAKSTVPLPSRSNTVWVLPKAPRTAGNPKSHQSPLRSKAESAAN